jgi:SAM-dependent methyltransferase
MLTRTEILQQIITTTGARHYLEIGVQHGKNFFPLRGARKTAVDPDFAFSILRRRISILKNPCNLWADYHSLTSDLFFERNHQRFDVVFIDGLHTYAQSLQDVQNALACLNPGGVIVLHDCNPPYAAAAHPAESFEHAARLNLPGWHNEWCGDTWKVIPHLLSQRSDLRTQVFDCDFGIGIVTSGPNDSPLKLSLDDVAHLSYADLEENRTALLNLKPESDFPAFLRSL